MKKIIASFLVVLLVLSVLGPVGATAETSHQLTDSEAAQIAGGSILSCGFYGYFFCCCLDLWIIEVCGCGAFGGI